MSNLVKTAISRRGLLKTGAGLAGTSALAFFPGSALAQHPIAPGGGSTSLEPCLYFWSGTSFVLAQHLPQGDPTLEYVNVSIEGFGTGAFSSIDGNFSISYGSTAQTVPFFAWTSPPAGLNKAVFSQPVGPMSGLLFTTHQSVGNSTISSPLPLSTGSGTVPKLIEGVYVLTNAPVNLSAYSYNPNLPATPVAVVAESVTPASFPYVVITIASR